MWRSRTGPAPAAGSGSVAPGWAKRSPASGWHQPGGDAQQRGFARAVAPDQADAVAGRDRQPRAGKQRRGPEGQADVLQQKQRRRPYPVIWRLSAEDFHLPGRPRLTVRDRSAMTGAAEAMLPAPRSASPGEDAGSQIGGSAADSEVAAGFDCCRTEKLPVQLAGDAIPAQPPTERIRLSSNSGGGQVSSVEIVDRDAAVLCREIIGHREGAVGEIARAIVEDGAKRVAGIASRHVL